MNQFESYLKTILTDKQIQVLADAVLAQNIVCLYGAGLGKSTLAKIFKSAGIRSVLAPEDCGADADCYTVLDCPGIIALSMKNEPFSNALDKDSFSKEEITASLADVLNVNIEFPVCRFTRCAFPEHCTKSALLHRLFKAL